MPILFLVIGVLAITVAVSGKQNQVAEMLIEDFRAAGQFALLVGAIMIVAIGGWIVRMPRAAHLLIVLIGLAYVLSSRGLWSQALTALEGTSAPAPADAAAVGSPATVAAGGSSQGGGAAGGGGGAAGGGGPLGMIGGLAGGGGGALGMIGGLFK